MKKTIFKNILLSSFTTYHIGGPAKYFFIAKNIYELFDILEWAKREGIPWFVLGRGSNLLIDDNGFPGLVIKLGGDFKKIEINESYGLVSAGGGCSLPKLGIALANKGWSGFEYMCVIPGTVGAAVRINAGTTKEGEIKDRFVSAQVLMPDLQIKTLSANELNFSYRYSNLIENNGIVLNTTFRLETRESAEILKKRVKELALSRKRRHPRNTRNCGSIFKRPKGGKSAGWYIEKAGLKGIRIGDAQIAPEHANWIINLGNARAKDVKALIELAQEKVMKKFNIKLEREVIYVPEDIISI